MEKTEDLMKETDNETDSLENENKDVSIDSITTQDNDTGAQVSEKSAGNGVTGKEAENSDAKTAVGKAVNDDSKNSVEDVKVEESSGVEDFVVTKETEGTETQEENEESEETGQLLVVMEKTEDLMKETDNETDSLENENKDVSIDSTTTQDNDTGAEVSEKSAGNGVTGKEAENSDAKTAVGKAVNDDSKNSVEDVKVEESSGVEDVVVTKDTEGTETQKENEESEETALNIDWSKEPALDDKSRNQMFEEGLKLDKAGQKVEALKRYLKCLVGLKENSRFALLPQCLRNIGDIYYGRDEFDKAISFIQAEKLYYESVLIDDTELQKHIDEVTQQGAGDAADSNIDALRASEYEQLAKLCLDEKQPQLALEYAGKCTKLRQKVYGDSHPLVQQSLDFFATVYAEVGKVQYTESMSKYAKSGEPDITSPAVSWETTPANSQSEPTSILRKRKNTEGEREKKVRFDESQVPSDAELDREERCARLLLVCFFFILLFVLFLLGVYLYCRLRSPSTCRNVGYYISDTMMYLKYWYFKLFSSDSSKYT